MPTHRRHLLGAITLALLFSFATLGATTAPARADSEDAAAVIGGLIALYALGRALNLDIDGGRTITPPLRPHRPVIREPQHRLIAPERCRREIRTREGLFRGYNFRCMQRNVRRVDLLPRNCLRQVRTDRGVRNFYAGRCLARNGWVREARPRH